MTPRFDVPLRPNGAAMDGWELALPSSLLCDWTTPESSSVWPLIPYPAPTVEKKLEQKSLFVLNKSIRPGIVRTSSRVSSSSFGDSRTVMLLIVTRLTALTAATLRRKPTLYENAVIHRRRRFFDTSGLTTKSISSFAFDSNRRRGLSKRKERISVRSSCSSLTHIAAAPKNEKELLLFIDY